MATQTPIKPWLLGSSDSALSASHELKQQGIWVSAIRPPTVPVGSARVRVYVSR
ncbi:8-amino-7-oxononanoate synthase [Vibrio cholerae]|nr:8-amino-7-oxononanoate synthase [Vibrio cholerae]